MYVPYMTPLPFTCLNRTWNGPESKNGEAVFEAIGQVS